jgi:hypothetical protein
VQEGGLTKKEVESTQGIEPSHIFMPEKRNERKSISGNCRVHL